MRHLYILLLSAFAFNCMAADWQLVKQDQQFSIQVYTRDITGSELKEFRGEMLLNSRLSALVALMEDTGAGVQWIFQCRALELLEQYSVYNKLFYMVTDAPWPVSDRDSVFASSLYQDPVSKIIHIEITARPDAFPPDDNFLRISTLRGYWEFIPQDAGQIRVIYQLFAEPGGHIPSWLANGMVVDNPYQTLKKMASLVKAERYQSAVVNYIEDMN